MPNRGCGCSMTVLRSLTKASITFSRRGPYLSFDFLSSRVHWMKPLRSSRRRPQPLFLRLLTFCSLCVVAVLYTTTQHGATYLRSDYASRSKGRGVLLQKDSASQSSRYLNPRASAVREAFLHAWKGYRQFAWGHDELGPVSQAPVDRYGNLGLTIVDALDTLIIMGFEEEYREARNWIATELHYEDTSQSMSFFETLIRHLGGLLSAYYLSGDDLFIEKAKDLGERLLRAYSPKNPLPHPYVRLMDLEYEYPEDGGEITLAEATTTELEFGALSALSGDDRFIEAAERTLDEILTLPTTSGLRKDRLDMDRFKNYGRLTFGANADSHYEYLLKRSIQLKSLGGGKETWEKYEKAYVAAMEGLETLLVHKSVDTGLTFLAERSETGSLITKMDHLSCFVPGMLALGAQKLGGWSASRYMRLADELVRTCYRFYTEQQTHLSPEAVHFYTHHQPNSRPDFSVRFWSHALRPETVESLYVLYKITGAPKYREWGWDIFRAWEEHAKVATGGYSGLKDVRRAKSYNDIQESFFLAETLKYLYLLFEDGDGSWIDLDKWVLNTEGHPLSLDRNWSSENARQELAAKFGKMRTVNSKNHDTEF